MPKQKKQHLEARTKRVLKQAYFKDLNVCQIAQALEEAAKVKKQAAGIFAQVSAAETALQTSLARSSPAPPPKKARPTAQSSGLKEVPKASLARPSKRALRTPPRSPIQ